MTAERVRPAHRASRTAPDGAAPGEVAVQAGVAAGAANAAAARVGPTAETVKAYLRSVRGSWGPDPGGAAVAARRAGWLP
ncbi:hypothetical protein ACWEQ5_05320 [Streptomyces griseoincarnatus]|uniref:HTH luxR-type domain-containing protein n=1 Tax=Streptomyces tunisiensis TaxID=948699 RepID=A0ABP7Y0E0_9ACTN